MCIRDRADYDKIREHDLLSISGLVHFAPGRNLTIVLHHEDGTKESFEAVSYTHLVKQIEKKIDVIQAHYFTEDEIYFHEIALYKVSTPAFQELSLIHI